MWEDFKGAILDNVSLKNEHLHGADLRETSVTKNQIKLAYTGEDTLVPNCISNKKTWAYRGHFQKMTLGLPPLQKFYLNI